MGVGVNCSTHELEVCASCKLGFKQVGDLCTAKQCSCTNGGGATEILCKNESVETCATCAPGYTLLDGLCKVNQCKCPGGTGTIGEKCKEMNHSSCASCDGDAILRNQQCLACAKDGTDRNAGPSGSCCPDLE